MLNRPATKIDLCLEEELNEYEEMKQLRLKNPIMFQNQFGTLSNFKTNDSSSKIPQIQNSPGTVQQFQTPENK